MTLINTNVVASRHLKREEVLPPVAVRHSKTPELKLNLIRGNENVTHSAQGEMAFLGGIFCLEYPSRRKCLFRKLKILISQTTDFHFANYRFSFRKLQIFMSQTTDFHFANYRFSFRKLQIFSSQITDFHFANYRFSFRKLQIFISQTTDFHFVSFHFVSFPFVSLHFVSQTTVSL